MPHFAGSGQGCHLPCAEFSELHEGEVRVAVENCAASPGDFGFRGLGGFEVLHKLLEVEKSGS